ncbi:MAG: PTS sugar transporter subunit IIC [Gemmatimonadaceae bacterium]|nr:PTS sugar transporter subunit IIC [Gemmatimonadaceae bacterium]
MIDTGALVTLTVVGAVVGLDFVSFPQAMLSRPLVAATLGGFVCGDATAGLLVGVLLECFALETMPFGASRYPEWGPASVAAGAVAVVPGGSALTMQVLPLAVLAGLVAAAIGGQTLVWLRRLNLAISGRYRDELAAGDATAVLAVHWTGLLIDFGRAGAVTALFVVTLLPLRDVVLGGLLAVDGARAVLLTAALAAGVGVGAVWKVVHNTKEYARYLAAGLLAGLLVAVLL